MSDALFWRFLTNTVPRINHAIDSASIQEWDLFHLPGGIVGALLIHFSLLAVVLYGLATPARPQPSAVWLFC